jgi:opacity protein-like surface antigen
MKTRLLFSASLVALLSLASMPSMLRAQSFVEGSHQLSVGHGAVTFLSNLNRSFDLYQDVGYSGLGPLYFKYEYAVTDKIGMGVNFAYAENEWSYRYSTTDENGNTTFYDETTKRDTYSILARMNFHFGNSERFDPYFGFGVGYRDANWRMSSTGPDGGSGVVLKSLMPFGMEFTLGGRYYFAKNIGLYAEVGAAKSVFQGGLVVKL